MAICINYSGFLEKDSAGNGTWVQMSNGSSFTQTELNDGKIRYNPPTNFNGSIIIQLKLTDGSPAAYTNNINFYVKVRSSVGTIIVTNYVMNVQEDVASHTLTQSFLKAEDDNIPSANLVYTLTSIDNLNGVLKNDTTVLDTVTNNTFTQNAINNYLIKYIPNTNYDSTANFKFTVGETASGPQSTEQTFTINVQNANNGPVIVKKTKTINEDTSTFITSNDLTITDSNTSTLSDIKIKLKSLTNLNGILQNVNTASTLITDSIFTAQDIHDGNVIKFIPNSNFNTGVAGNQSIFEFESYDEDNDYAESGGSTTFTFTFNITGVNDIPTITLGNALEFNSESGPGTLTTSILTSSDIDVAGDPNHSETKFVIITAPSNGTISVNRGSTVNLTGMGNIYNITTSNYFTQTELATNNNVKYTPNTTGFFGQDTFTVRLKDTAMSQAEFENNTLNPLSTMVVNVKSIYDDLTLTNNIITFDEDDNAGTIYPFINITDGTGTITYTIDNTDNLNGYLTKTVNGVTSSLSTNDTFTQSDLASNNVKYEPLNNFNGSASFTFSANDESIPVKDILVKHLELQLVQLTIH